MTRSIASSDRATERRVRAIAVRIAPAVGAFTAAAMMAMSPFVQTARCQEPPPNRPPQTVILSSPPDSTNATSYRVHFSWSGSDPDSADSVHHFDFIMVDHPRTASHIDGPDDPTRVVVRVPDPQDPRWTSTNTTDSVFVTLADVLRRDPRPGPGETAADVLATQFERWHTFFIRAVDSNGFPDPTPDYRSFNSTTRPPTADGQPVFLLARGQASDAFVTRALCGFRPHLLAPQSHLALAQHVLLDQMALSPVPVVLADFRADAADDAVHIAWRLSNEGSVDAFRLQANNDASTWTVPHVRVGTREYSATDRSPERLANPAITYSLYSRDAESRWVLLAREDVVSASPSHTSRLGAPRPNPFNPRTTIPFELAEAQHVRLVVYRLDGREVKTLVDAVRPRGSGFVIWNGDDAHGRAVASGVYAVRMEAGGTILSRRLVLVR